MQQLTRRPQPKRPVSKPVEDISFDGLNRESRYALALSDLTLNLAIQLISMIQEKKEEDVREGLVHMANGMLLCNDPAVDEVIAGIEKEYKDVR